MRQLALACLVLTFALSGANAANTELDPTSRAAWNGVKGSYAAALFEQAQKMELTCADSDGKCSLGRLANKIDVFSSTDSRHVVAVVYHTSGGGSGVQLETLVLERGAGGYAYQGGLSTFYGQPQKITFGGNAATMTARTMKPEDPHCCPTGETIYRINLGSRSVSYVSGNVVQGVPVENAKPPAAKASGSAQAPFVGDWCVADADGNLADGSPQEDISISPTRIDLLDAYIDIGRVEKTGANTWTLHGIAQPLGKEVQFFVRLRAKGFISTRILPDPVTYYRKCAN